MREGSSEGTVLWHPGLRVITQLEARNRTEIEKIQWNNPFLEKASIVCSGWLKRNLGEKRASTIAKRTLTNKSTL
jgi:hypothetical protein